MAKHDGTYAIGGDADATVVAVSDGTPRIVAIAGWSAAGADDRLPPDAAGIVDIAVDGVRLRADEVLVHAISATGDTIALELRLGSTGLMLQTRLSRDASTGVVRRDDVLINGGSGPAALSRCLSRIPLARGRYEIYAQESRWCGENQGSWRPLGPGAVVLTHLPGRTTEGATPFIAIRHAGRGEALAAHLLPRGNYAIRAETVPSGGDLPFALLELGLAGRGLHYRLEPGERLELPAALFQRLEGGEPEAGTAALHRYLLDGRFAGRRPAPVVYNTWFDQFDRIEVDRLREQLAAAREVGCEVFVIDAGWFGAGQASWSTQTGNWHENRDAAFRGRMQAFADEVRSAGLGFGLWMEPERFGPDAPVRREHPEWFVPVGDAARLDLDREAVRRFIRSEIDRLVTTYRLAWMKVDFNFSLGADDTGRELCSYYEHWYRILDEVRRAHPDTFFEGCASGGLRCDIESLSHCDAHFLSDTVNPIDGIRIAEGAWLRLPPGLLSRWAVVRSAGPAVPRYGSPMSEAPPMVVVPKGALWEPAESVDLEFALAAALPGAFGLSGDPASLGPRERSIVARAVDYYKRNRTTIVRAAGRLLTPPHSLGTREGWAAVQLAAGETHIVVVYRLGRCGAAPAIRPVGLEAQGTYSAAIGFDEEAAGEIAGSHLMAHGLETTGLMPPAHHGCSALVWTLRRFSESPFDRKAPNG